AGDHVRPLHLRLPDLLALAVDLGDLVGVELTQQHVSVGQDIEIETPADRVKRHAEALQLLAGAVEADVLIVVVIDEGKGAVAEAGRGEEVVIVALNVEDFLAVTVDLKELVAAGDEGIAVLEPLGGKGLNDHLVPLDVALEVALGDTIDVLLGDQHTVMT